MGKQSQLLLKPTEVELGLQVGLQVGLEFDKRKEKIACMNPLLAHSAPHLLCGIFDIQLIVTILVSILTMLMNILTNVGRFC